MRTFFTATLASLAMGVSIKSEQSGFGSLDGILDTLVSWFDTDGDGALSETEFVEMLEYLDEDTSLTQAELDHALNQYQIYLDSEKKLGVIWLTDTLSSTADGEGSYLDMTEGAFWDFWSKCGMDSASIEQAWLEADQDADGKLSLSEQDSMWQLLMEQNEEFEMDDLSNEQGDNFYGGGDGGDGSSGHDPVDCIEDAADDILLQVQRLREEGSWTA